MNTTVRDFSMRRVVDSSGRLPFSIALVEARAHLLVPAMFAVLIIYMILVMVQTSLAKNGLGFLSVLPYNTTTGLTELFATIALCAAALSGAICATHIVAGNSHVLLHSLPIRWREVTQIRIGVAVGVFALSVLVTLWALWMTTAFEKIDFGTLMWRCAALWTVGFVAGHYVKSLLPTLGICAVVTVAYVILWDMYTDTNTSKSIAAPLIILGAFGVLAFLKWLDFSSRTASGSTAVAVGARTCIAPLRGGMLMAAFWRVRYEFAIALLMLVVMPFLPSAGKMAGFSVGFLLLLVTTFQCYCKDDFSPTREPMMYFPANRMLVCLARLAPPVCMVVLCMATLIINSRPNGGFLNFIELVPLILLVCMSVILCTRLCGSRILGFVGGYCAIALMAQFSLGSMNIFAWTFFVLALIYVALLLALEGPLRRHQEGHWVWRIVQAALVFVFLGAMSALWMVMPWRLMFDLMMGGGR